RRDAQRHAALQRGAHGGDQLRDVDLPAPVAVGAATRRGTVEALRHGGDELRDADDAVAVAVAAAERHALDAVHAASRGEIDAAPGSGAERELMSPAPRREAGGEELPRAA